MTTANVNVNPTARRLAILVIAIIVALMLAGVGWIFAGRIGRPPDSELSEVRPAASNAYRLARAISGGNAPNNPNVHQTRAGDFNFIANKNGTNWTLRLNYIKPDLIPPDQAAALLARFRLTSDAGFAKSLKVSDDQIKRLKEIPQGTGLIVSDSDRARIHKAWDQYIAKPDAPNEAELSKVAQEVGQSSLQPTRAALGERAVKVQSILTAEQIAPFKQ